MSSAPTPPIEGEVTIDSIVSGDGKGRRAFGRMIGVAVGLSLAIILVLIAVPLIQGVPLEHRAKRYVSLPSDVSYRSVREANGGEDAVVEFTLPEPKGKGSRMNEIGTAIGFPPPVATKPTKSKAGSIPRGVSSSWTTQVKGDLKTGKTFILNRGYGEIQTLTYDPAHGIYRYSVKRN